MDTYTSLVPTLRGSEATPRWEPTTSVLDPVSFHKSTCLLTFRKSDFWSNAHVLDVEEWPSKIEESWEILSRESFGAEACFFNCTNESYKKAVLTSLNEVESAMTDFAHCVLLPLQKMQLIEESLPLTPLPIGAFCNNQESTTGFCFTQKEIIQQVEAFVATKDIAILAGLGHKVEVMKEYVRVYVETNRENVVKYVIDETDPAYTEYPAWMFFPFQDY